MDEGADRRDLSGDVAAPFRPARERSALVVFVVLAYAFSWAWWIPLIVNESRTEPGQGWPTHLPGLLGPAAAAFVATGWAGGFRAIRELARRCVRWRVRARWYVLITVTLAAASLPLLLLDASAADLAAYSGAPEVFWPVTLTYVLVVNGFGEEIGWRGFLVHHLSRRQSLRATSVIVWVAWGGWHLPLFWIVGNFRELGVGGIIGWTIGLLAGSIVLAWLYLSAGRSILIVALWHTAFNVATATRGAAGVSAAVVSTAVMIAAVVIWWRNQLDP